jgi:hypothetical protein
VKPKKAKAKRPREAKLDTGLTEAERKELHDMTTKAMGKTLGAANRFPQKQRGMTPPVTEL